MKNKNEKWVNYRLEETARLISGRTPDRERKEYYSETGTPWVKIENLDQGVITETSEYLSGLGREKVNLVPEGSVLFSIVGTVGKVGIAGKELAANQQIVAFLFDEEKILPAYGYYLLRFHAKEIRKLANQTTMALISRKTLGQYRVSVPESLRLQREIVDRLMKYENYAKSKETFRKRLDGCEVLLFQRIFIREIQYHERLELREFLKEPIFGGGFRGEDQGETAVCICGGDFQKPYLQKVSGSSEGFPDSEVQQEGRLSGTNVQELLQDGDILLRNGKLLLAEKPDMPAVFERNILCIRTKQTQLLPEVLYAYLSLPEIKSILYAGRKPGDSRKRPIRARELERMEIPYFTMVKQREFAACLQKLREIWRAADQEEAYAWKLFWVMSRLFLTEQKKIELSEEKVYIPGEEIHISEGNRGVICRLVLAVLCGWCPQDQYTGEYCQKRRQIFRIAQPYFQPAALSLVYRKGQEEYLLERDFLAYRSHTFTERWKNPLQALQELLEKLEAGELRDAHLAFQGTDGIETEAAWAYDVLERMAGSGFLLLQEYSGLGACSFLLHKPEEDKVEREKIRMVGLDLDGTVFNEKKIITQHTKAVIQKAIEQGVIVLPATGRPECGLPSEFLQIPGVRYALTSNGARIIDLLSGETVYEQFIPWDVALRAVAIMEQWEGCVWEAYIQGKIYVEETKYYFLNHPDMTPALIDYIHKTRTPMKDLKKKIEREKIGLEKLHMLFENTKIRDQKIKELSSLFPELAVSCATTFNVEINSSKAGKGTGLLALGKILGIKKEEIMACGDATNDWDMLKAVGFPVVMENGDDRTKQLAAFITRSNEADGVAYALEKFVILPSKAEDKE